MIASLVRYKCPFCAQVIVEMAASLGPTVCPRCFRAVSQEEALREGAIPFWVWGVVALLAGCLLCR